jgi:CRISPR-associated endoribonuclease Cas6
MRIHLKIKAKGVSIPFDHLPKLVGCIHKWIGQNDLHGEMSLYSFSFLNGGKKLNNSLIFENGASMFISSFNQDLIKLLISGIQKDSEMFLGLKVGEIIMQQDPDLSEKSRFLLSSPILIKRSIDKKTKYYFYNDSESCEILKDTIINKLSKVGMSDDSLSIEFDKEYRNPKTKLINYKGINNRASMCPVIINAKPETKKFIWNVGLGNSTGIGFGAIK